jgi:hypothetical protein
MAFPVGAVSDEVVAGETLESLGDRHMADAHACSKVGRSSFAAFGDQILNQFKVVGGQFRAGIVSGFLVAFG